ncbi:MAG: response regulator [Alphaproteobacteria bacterium]
MPSGIPKSHENMEAPAGSQCTVYVVDDLETNRLHLNELLSRDGWRVTEFDSAQAFLDGFDETKPFCVLLDVRMPDMSGLDLQKILNERGVVFPIIIVTAHADVPMAISAMQAGAYDFIERPASNDLVLEKVAGAARESLVRYEELIHRNRLKARIGQLSPREMDVLEEMIKGEMNKQIAHTLSISERTVEVHRSNVMRKMEVRSLAELVRVMMQVRPSGSTG